MSYTKSMLCTLAVATLLAGCAEKKGKQQDKAVCQTMTVSKSDQTLLTEYSARLTGRQIVEVRPQVSGTLTRICTGEGQRVQQGQVLFVIDQVPYKAALSAATAAVSTAEAKLATARMNYENDQKLLASNVVSDFVVQTSHNTLREAEAALLQAKAQEQNARWQLGCTVVKSPVSGVASMIPWHVGALVGPSTSEPLLTVADDREMLAYFSMTDRQSMDIISQYGSLEAFVKQAPAVSLRLAGGRNYELEGHIDAVSGTVDELTGAVTLRATFQNPNHLLHNGAAATIVLPMEKKAVVVVPQAATYELQNRTFVYRIEDGKTKATPVMVFPLNNGREYIVEEGLSVGDVIVSEGAGLLKDGVEVETKKTSEQKP